MRTEGHSWFGVILISCFFALSQQNPAGPGSESIVWGSRGIFRCQMERAQGGCLGSGRRRRTRPAAKCPGEEQASCDPGVSEWGNPAACEGGHSFERANPGN